MKLTDYAQTTLKLAFGAAAICLILSAVAHFLVPHVANPHHALLLLRSYQEASSALLGAGVCAALICDVVLKKDGPK